MVWLIELTILNEQNSFFYLRLIMRLFIFSFIFIFSACTDATENDKGVVEDDSCDIFFKGIGPCVHKSISVNVGVEKIADDEQLLKTLNVNNKGMKYTLQIKNETTMLDGDRGYISFEDINFDGFPDIAITTSFGLANLYLDYWVYDSHLQKYSYLGNYSQFKLDHKLKTLMNVVKINAAKYENSTYLWKGYDLIKQ